MHYSRTVPVAADRHRYFPSTAILLGEVIKLIVSLSIAGWEITATDPSASPRKFLTQLHQSIFSPDCWKLAIPAISYTLQSSLIYVAVSNLDAVTFQVSYQLKILTTVLFSMAMLGKTVSPRQWLALLILTIGVATVQTSQSLMTLKPLTADLQSRLSKLLFRSLETKSSSPAAEKLHGSLIKPLLNPTHGFLAVIVASITSGATGVYFEKVVKESSTTATLWTRNVQLSFFSLFPALFIGVLWKDWKEISQSGGFFVGYDSMVWTTVALQAFGGITVSICITYADNIAKNFAASISIIFSCMASAMVFGTPLTTNVGLKWLFWMTLFTDEYQVLIGASLVVLSTYMYTGRDRAAGLSLLPTNKGDDRMNGRSEFVDRGIRDAR